MKTMVIAAILTASLPAAVAAAPDAAGVAINAKPTAAEKAAIMRVLGPEFRSGETNGRMPDVSVGHADLNGDKRADLLVRASGMGWCGSAGCSTYAILATSAGYAKSPIYLATSAAKLIVLPATHKGMHDLRFAFGTYTFKWNGKEYQ